MIHNPSLVSALKRCQNKEQVEHTFARFRKDDDVVKIKYLDICRGNPQTFFAGPGKADDETELHSRYLTIRSMFLTGSWR